MAPPLKRSSVVIDEEVSSSSHNINININTSNNNNTIKTPKNNQQESPGDPMARIRVYYNGYRKMIRPLELSMQLCLLRPVYPLQLSLDGDSASTSSTSSNDDRRWLRRINYLVALFFVVIGWLFPLRLVVFLATMKTGSEKMAIAQTLYFYNIILYQMCCATVRTVLFHHNFNTGLVDRAVNELRREMGSLRQWKAAICPKGRTTITLVSGICWVFVVGNFMVLLFLYTTRFDLYHFMVSPLHLYPHLLKTDSTLRYAAIAGQMVTHFSNDSAGGFCNAFIFCYNVTFALAFREMKHFFKAKLQKHHDLHHDTRYADVEYHCQHFGNNNNNNNNRSNKPISAREMDPLVNNGSKAATDNSNDAEAYIGIEEFRMHHLRLGNVVKVWDRCIRYIVAVTLASSFVSSILYIYFILYDHSNTLNTVFRLTWLSVSMIFIIVNLTSASFLNHSAHSVVTALHLLRSNDTLCSRHRTRNSSHQRQRQLRMAASVDCLQQQQQQQQQQEQQVPCFTDDYSSSSTLLLHQSDAIQINLFLSQLETEPIGITVLGMAHIRKGNVISFVGLMVTYFLLLVDYSGGKAPDLALLTNSNLTSMVDGSDGGANNGTTQIGSSSLLLLLSSKTGGA